MVFLTGDTHGLIDIQKVRDFFVDKTNLTKNDYLIILGDCGCCWSLDENDENTKNELSKLPVTVLFIDGNHENHNYLDSLEAKEWNGGKVHFIRDDIIHLMRGQVFNIDNKSFFTFGGAFSMDKMYREEGISYWKRELPSKEELEAGVLNLIKNNSKIDYVLTHTCPNSIILNLIPVEIGEDKYLTKYLSRIAEYITFKDWYFGHFHKDVDIDNYHCLYDRVIKLD